jgi:glycosyltransferase involved in cell wall biosynthesis
MRCELFRRSAPVGLDVSTVVVPVAGRVPGRVPRSPATVVMTPDRVSAKAGAAALLADPRWRDRLARAGLLPALTRAASPGLVGAVVRAVAGDGAVAVHVMRSYLAPLGAAVAERLGARWVTLDLDEDDAALAAARSQLEEASGYSRLLDVFGPLFDGLSAASARDADAIGGRHGLAVEQLPNAVDLPASLSDRRGPADRSQVSVLFVGNLTYAPNIEAVHLLVQDVLPALRRRLRRRVHVTLVGPHHPSLARLAGEGVQVTGYVSDLGPVYASSDVVVVPLLSGGGTRIKLLEAFAHGVPVVASYAAAAGLEVSGGRHLLLADQPDEIAAAVAAVVTEPSLAERLVVEAHHLVSQRYCTSTVVTLIREFYRRAAGHSEP